MGYGTITQEVNKYTWIVSPAQDYFISMAHTIHLYHEMNMNWMLRCYLAEIIVQKQWMDEDWLTSKSNRWKRWIGSKILENSFAPISSVVFMLSLRVWTKRSTYRSIFRNDVTNNIFLLTFSGKWVEHLKAVREYWIACHPEIWMNIEYISKTLQNHKASGGTSLE